MTRSLSEQMKRVGEGPSIAPPPPVESLASRAARTRRRAILKTGAVVLAAAAVGAFAVPAMLGTVLDVDSSTGIDGGVASQPPTGSGRTSEETFNVDCPSSDTSRQITSIDSFADGEATPEQAISGLLRKGESTSDTEVAGDNAKIAILRSDGSTRAVVTLEKVDTGWRASGLVGCAGDAPFAAE